MRIALKVHTYGSYPTQMHWKTIIFISFQQNSLSTCENHNIIKSDASGPHTDGSCLFITL